MCACVQRQESGEGRGMSMLLPSRKKMCQVKKKVVKHARVPPGSLRTVLRQSSGQPLVVCVFRERAGVPLVSRLPVLLSGCPELRRVVLGGGGLTVQRGPGLSAFPRCLSRAGPVRAKLCGPGCHSGLGG